LNSLVQTSRPSLLALSYLVRLDGGWRWVRRLGDAWGSARGLDSGWSAVLQLDDFCSLGRLLDGVSLLRQLSGGNEC